LRPLLAFSNLRDVMVTVPAGFSFDDDFCTAMAKAWPKVEILHLETGGHRLAGDVPSLPSDVNITSLASFAQHCPRLHELRIAVDAVNTPESYPPPDAPRVVQTSLVYLDVHYSPITSPPLVACFLSAIFPSLNSI
ncbi:hypothetical protein C8R44DRAFT_589739, partial [Mycena epipterygia]